MGSNKLTCVGDEHVLYSLGSVEFSSTLAFSPDAKAGVSVMGCGVQGAAEEVVELESARYAGVIGDRRALLLAVV
jgi:hypothetical protein